MATKDLTMMDEKSDNSEAMVNIVLSDKCLFTENTISIPMNEALSIIANIAIQVTMAI